MAVVHAAHSKVRPESRVSVRILRDRGDFYFAWRRPIPVVYLPVGAMPAVIAWARTVGMEIRETPGSQTYPATMPDAVYFDIGHLRRPWFLRARVGPLVQ